MFICTVKSYFTDRDGDEADTDEDGTDNTDEERFVVSPAYALVKPLTMMIKDMNTLVTNRTMFGPLATDRNITKVAPTIFYHTSMLGLVKLWYGLLGILGQQSRV